MVDVKKLNDRISVATQILSSDLRCFVDQGFKTIINNRPDGEEIDQPKTDALAKEAQRLGLAYFSLPVISGSITDDEIDQFDHIVENQNGPILAFCRTGTRSTILWALSEADNATTDDILQSTKKAGYDLSSIKPRIEERRIKTTRQVRNCDPSSRAGF